MLWCTGGFREALNYAPMMLRGASLSDSSVRSASFSRSGVRWQLKYATVYIYICNSFSRAIFDDDTRNILYIYIYIRGKYYRPSASWGNNGGAPPAETHRAMTALYRIDGVHVGPSIPPTWRSETTRLIVIVIFKSLYMYMLQWICGTSYSLES